MHVTIKKRNGKVADEYMDTNDLQMRIKALAHQYQSEDFFPTASIRVFDRHQTLCTVCIGNATDDSLFDVASLTKIATSTHFLHLIQKGVVELDSPLHSLFPEIQKDPYLCKRLEKITLYHLLTHTSTITPWFPFYSRKHDDFWTIFRYVLMNNDPVDGMEYSDLNYMLLGILWQRLSQLSLRECLQNDLVIPLKLGKMLYHPACDASIVPSCYDNAIEMDMCSQRSISFSGFRPMNTPVCGSVNDGNAHYYFNDAAGHAGIFADTAAYMRLCQFYMNSPDPLFQAAQKEQPNAATRGLGFQTGPMYPHGCGHTGFTGTSIYFSSEYNIGVIAFTNRLFYPFPIERNMNEFRKALHKEVFDHAAQG